MANNGKDGNRLRYGFLKKHQDVSFSKDQVWLKSLPTCNILNTDYELNHIFLMASETSATILSINS